MIVDRAKVDDEGQTLYLATSDEKAEHQVVAQMEYAPEGLLVWSLEENGGGLTLYPPQRVYWASIRRAPFEPRSRHHFKDRPLHHEGA